MLAVIIVLPRPLESQAFDVRSYRPWTGYAIPNGVWLTGDFDNDKRTDVFHAVASGDYSHLWTSVGNGSFTMSTFRPWPGYAIPNGVWLTGDFDGDKRTDVVHAVASGDYAHVWTSTGGGGFTVTTFRPWPGYAIPNGVWLVGDYDGDQKSDILHAVASGDYAHIWLSTGGGNFNVATFRPWPGYAIPNGIWRTGDFDADGKTDILHAVASGGYAHTWLSTGPGTFNVTTFQPWPGYGIPNGEWLVGDFDGDARADVFHAVASGDYAHVWSSTGGGNFSVGTFRPWPGYAIPNGVWLAGDLNKDNKTDIVHAVANTDYAHVWRSQGSASFAVQSFSPWAGYAIPNGLWLNGDLNADGKSDLFHAVASGDYAHPWLSVFPGPLEVTVDGLEVTQAIQDMTHTVTLVANKTTWVRAYLTANSTTPVTVQGTLQARNVATGVTTSITSNGSTTLDPAQAGQLRPKRESITGSLNFPIPAGFIAAGDKQFTLTGVTNTATGAPGTCSNCVTAARTVSFVASSPMRVRIVGISYTTGAAPNTVTQTPATLDFTLTQSWLGRAFPTGQLVATQVTVASTSAWPFNCNTANAQLTTMRNNEIANNAVDNRAHYAGLVSVGGGYMTGCAQLPGTVGSSPTGPTASGTRPLNVTGDADGSFGDWYTGHELGHTYNRQHPGFCNGNSASDPSFPNPNGQISDNAGTFTGLDVGDAANGIAPAVLPGATRFDIMTYCNQPQWLSAYTYEGVRARLNFENPAGTGAPAGGAQRVFARARPAPDCPCDREIRPSRVGPPRMRTARRAPPEPRLAQKIAPPLPAPAYERTQLPSRPFAERFDSSSVVPARRFPAPVERGFVPRGTLWPLEAPTPAVQIRIGDFVNIVVSVNVTRNTAQIRYVNRVTRAEVPLAVNDRRASIRVRDAAGRVLLDQPVEVRHDSDTPPGEDQLAIIDGMIPYNPAIALVEIVLSGDVVASRRVSRRVPVVGELRSAATQIRRANADPEPAVTLRWQGSDPDGDSLTYTVETAAAPRLTWETIAIGFPVSELTLSRAQFGDRRQLRVRVTANDGFNRSAPITTTISRP